ncbi:uncharacterized protein LOC117797805 [Ailuropoda melanoleuca]|uniref:uncharacterized protein LOC117797805 n=1 Tax=Ailuropoda melanoleuca TaxID=9646 RepID=UPI00149402F2|nr:uncharacterized protein LOC117797805 [Ailuropoda melanoleuca]
MEPVSVKSQETACELYALVECDLIWTWGCCRCSQLRALPMAEATSILLCVWCDLSSSTRAQGRAWAVTGWRPFARTAPLGTEGGEEKEAWGIPAQPTVGTRACVTVACTPVHLMPLSYCTGSLSPPVLTQPPYLSASLDHLPDSPAHSALCVVSAATKHTGSSSSQGALLVSAEVLLGLRSAPGLWGPQPLLWVQRCLGQCRVFSSLGCRLRTRLTITVLQLMAVGAATLPTVSQIRRK